MTLHVVYGNILYVRGALGSLIQCVLAEGQACAPLQVKRGRVVNSQADAKRAELIRAHDTLKTHLPHPIGSVQYTREDYGQNAFVATEPK